MEEVKKNQRTKRTTNQYKKKNGIERELCATKNYLHSHKYFLYGRFFFSRSWFFFIAFHQFNHSFR